MTEPRTMEELFSIAELQADVRQLRVDIEESTAATKELVEAWKAAQSLVTFVKWGSTLVTAVGILWVAIRYFFVTH